MTIIIITHCALASSDNGTLVVVSAADATDEVSDVTEVALTEVETVDASVAETMTPNDIALLIHVRIMELVISAAELAPSPKPPTRNNRKLSSPSLCSFSVKD